MLSLILAGQTDSGLFYINEILPGRKTAVPRHLIEKIRDAIRTGNYDMTFHALEEMAEDKLRIIDVENAVLNGKIIRNEKDDPRGTKYVIKGSSSVQPTSIGVVGRFKETGIFLILTVYAVS